MKVRLLGKLAKLFLVQFGSLSPEIVFLGPSVNMEFLMVLGTHHKLVSSKIDGLAVDTGGL